LIHSVSFDLALKIFNGVSKKNKQRILVYNGTEEKILALDLLKTSKNKVILGPSLITGISLDNDLARWCVFAKCPYPSLSNRFIKAKMEINPSWYSEKTIVEILQGVGRAIRSENDFCSTYFLDANLGDLLFKHRKSFPQHFLNRIKVVNE
jgi:Rad3-related DNA helicase